MTDSNTSIDDYIPALERLLKTARGGDEERFLAQLDDLTSLRERAMFQDIGRLTRQLHESLTNFQLDSRVASLATSDFPDARDRLDRVIEMTEQSAHRTMDLVEEAVPVVEQILTGADQVESRWAALDAGDQVNEALVARTRQFVGQVADQALTLRKTFSDVLIAQNFQDLSGQIIRDIIGLVKEVEDTLVNMIRISGRSADLVEQQADARRRREDSDRARNQDDVDDILSSLGF
ncbi:protein phosphatase CheZ [Wenzhouxiangella limi]|uniref:Protein phosphatase CheZ n=1 Tax=Wenzhouxiangella limi TaxID=2707351 RepID=A0A845UV01_9GAMM|nr:protein phosphatase CheZ [Wenzhouxiangella limi]NDY95327.1 protein phosphatase CheZ [Wenzhouxiangella limi]